MPVRAMPSKLRAGTGRAACAQLWCGGTGGEPNSTSKQQSACVAGRAEQSRASRPEHGRARPRA
eukprot:9777857-Lingulodinium_polyedra.AAC.1